MSSSMSDTILALLDWSAHTGRDLPLPAETIAALEAADHVVDLETGEISYNGASEIIELTALGEAMTVVLAYEAEGGRCGYDSPAGPLE